MRITTRPATDTDRPTLESFMADLQEFERALHPESRRPGAEIAADHLAYLLGEVGSHDGCCLIAEAEGQPVGFLIGYVEVDTGHYLTGGYETPAHVSDLYVVEEMRGHGVIDALLAAAEAHFRSVGARQMTLSYLVGNDGAERAYEKRGFQPYMRVAIKPLR
jgi:GNAT superfamily N-acetyltransferase